MEEKTNDDLELLEASLMIASVRVRELERNEVDLQKVQRLTDALRSLRAITSKTEAAQ